MQEQLNEGRNEGPDFRTYWRIIVRGWWIFVIFMVLAGSAGYYRAASAPDSYSATAKIYVQGGTRASGLSVGDLDASSELASNVVELITTRPVLELVIGDLGLTYGPDSLRRKILVDSSKMMIEITARDRDPSLAAQIATVTAQDFIDEFQRQQFQRIAQFQATLSQYGIPETAEVIAAQAATLSTLTLIEEGITPGGPVSKNIERSVIVALLAGLVVAGFLASLRDYLDDTVKTPDELWAQTGVTTLASVRKFGSKDQGWGSSPTEDNEHTQVDEAYKFLQTNIGFAAMNSPGFRSLMVTSSVPAEGKTTTVYNLARSVALEGRSIIVVDTDLRRAGLAKEFGVPNATGLSHVLLGSVALADALSGTEIEGLRVIAAGPLPPDPAVILRSSQLKALAAELEQMADLVIYDTPPLLLVTDGLLLAPLIHGVLMVVAAESTHRRAIKDAIDMLSRSGTPLLGAVLNKTSERRAGGYYYGYGYGKKRASRRERLAGAVRFWRREQA